MLLGKAQDSLPPDIVGHSGCSGDVAPRLLRMRLGHAACRYSLHLAWSGHHILLVFDAIGGASAPAVTEGALLCQSSFYFG